MTTFIVDTTVQKVHASENIYIYIYRERERERVYLIRRLWR